jgi:hypothetical protein
MIERSALELLLARVGAFDAEAQGILGAYEEAPARVITLQASYARLTGLSLDQDELFRESLRAVESGLFRAAHVLAWAGFIDFFHNFLAAGHLVALRIARPKWTLATAEDLRDQSDFQVIEAAKEAGIYDKTLMKALQGVLNKRNECAHPSEYFPDMNQTLGYVSELFSRVDRLQKIA